MPQPPKMGKDKIKARTHRLGEVEELHDAGDLVSVMHEDRSMLLTLFSDSRLEGMSATLENEQRKVARRLKGLRNLTVAHLGSLDPAPPESTVPSPPTLTLTLT